MSSAEAYLALQTKIGHEFADQELLRRALTHASRASEPNNERLEFLGDRVLGMVIADLLYHRDLDATEGQLAPIFAALVRKETCADIARDVSLPDALHLSAPEAASGGREKGAIVGDAMEAVIAAVYLDGGMDRARAVIEALWAPYLAGTRTLIADPKTALQEWSQARGLGLPVYTETDRQGPDHAPVFTLAVSIEGNGRAEGNGTTKRDAEQAAARKLLAELEPDNG